MMRCAYIAFAALLICPSLGMSQPKLDSLLAVLDKNHAQEKRYGYEVRVHSDLIMNEELEASDITFRVYVNGDITVYDMDFAGTTIWMDTEKSIKVDPKQQIMTLEYAEKMDVLTKLLGALSVDTNKPIQIDHGHEIVSLTYHTTGVAGEVNATFTADQLRPVTYEFKSIELHDGQTAYSVYKSAEITKIPSKDIDRSVFKQKYIENIPTNINPTPEYADYRLLNVLF